MSPLEKLLLISSILVSAITVSTVSFRVAKTWFRFLNDWEGNELNPGVMKRLQIGADRFDYLEDKLEHLNHEISDIKSELYSNGGSSLRDSINRIENNTAKTVKIKKK